MSTYAFDEAKNLLNWPTYKVWVDKMTFSSLQNSGNGYLTVDLIEYTTAVNEMFDYFTENDNVVLGANVNARMYPTTNYGVKTLCFSDMWQNDGSLGCSVFFHISSDIQLSSVGSDMVTLTYFELVIDETNPYFYAYFSTTFPLPFDVQFNGNLTFFTVEF